jgi:hypothetical protein
VDWDSGNTLDDRCHVLDDAQKNHRRASAIELLELLPGREAYAFDGIATGDESWFHYHYEPREKFAASRETVTRFVRTQLEVQKNMIIVSFTSTTLIINEALPRGRKFNQIYFTSTVPPESEKEKQRLLRRMRYFPSRSM